MSRQGMEGIPVTGGLRVLGRLVAGGAIQAGVFVADWVKVGDHLPPGLPFYSNLIRSVPAATAVRKADSEPLTLRATLERRSPPQRWSLLEDRVRAEVVRVLGIGAGRPVEGDRPLQELGLDSLMAVELRNALGKAVGRTLPATLLFDQPTVDRVVAYLGRVVFAMEPSENTVIGAGPHPAGAGKAGDATIEDLSEDEMADLLAQRLDAIDEGRAK